LETLKRNITAVFRHFSLSRLRAW